MKPIKTLLAGCLPLMVVCCFNTACQKDGSLQPHTDSTTYRVVDSTAVSKYPVADAGKDQYFTLPLNSAILDGSASFSPRGKIVGYHWTKVSGPDTYLVENPGTAITKVTGLTKGLYEFKLTVTNDKGFRSDDPANYTGFKDIIEVGVNMIHYKNPGWEYDTNARLIRIVTPELPAGFMADKIGSVWLQYEDYPVVGSFGEEVAKVEGRGYFTYKVENNKVVVYAANDQSIEWLLQFMEGLIIMFD